MANRKISDLTALTAPVTGDLLPIVDISEAAAANKNKKITYGTFLSSVPLGTAAAPSIAFTGDPNTGIYSPGADQLAISTNGSERARIDSSGRLLVGTTTQVGNVNGGILQLGSGITFPATPVAASDVNTLDDYEEGTWTPSDGSGAGRIFTNLLSSYVKIGREVTVNSFFTVDVSTNVVSFRINGLPFSSVVSTQTTGTFASSSGNAGISVIGASSSAVVIVTPATYNTNLLNSQISNCGVALTLTYFV